MKVSQFKRAVALCFMVLTCQHASAEGVAIVVGKNAKLTAITTEEAMKVWLGQSKRVDGNKVHPLEQEKHSPVREEFHKQVTKKNENELKAYWGRLIFSGKSFPPRELSTDAEVKAWLSTHDDALGYIDADSVDDSVKVLMTIK